MVNKCELSANCRHSQQAKDADRLEPKWCAIGTGTQAFPVVDKRLPADREDLTHFGRQAEHSKPCPCGNTA
jgi:hypothetical protein